MGGSQNMLCSRESYETPLLLSTMAQRSQAKLCVREAQFLLSTLLTPPQNPLHNRPKTANILTSALMTSEIPPLEPPKSLKSARNALKMGQ
eukprot:175864-Amphidinium_carterae.1